jgi:hypothetical protein
VKFEVRELSFVRGWPETRETLGEWRRRPATILVWLLASAGIAALLLTLVWIVGERSPVSPERPAHLPGTPYGDQAAHMFQLLRNNMVVLALHAVACFAGYVIYIGMSEDDEGWVGETTRALSVVALLFVPCATLLSIGTQAWVLGSYAATAGGWLHLSVWELLATTIPHSGIELTAVFLPLAAWLTIRLRGRPQQLLAATIVSTAIALPMLMWAAYVEAYVWPQRVREVMARHPQVAGMSLGELQDDPTDHFSGGVDLTVGAPVGSRSFEDRADAERAASGASGLGRGAVVILATNDAFIVHHVEARDHPSACAMFDGAQLGRLRPLHLADIDQRRFDPQEVQRPRLARPVEFVEGLQTSFVDALVAPAPPDHFADCDR